MASFHKGRPGWDFPVPSPCEGEGWGGVNNCQRIIPESRQNVFGRSREQNAVRLRPSNSKTLAATSEIGSGAVTNYDNGGTSRAS